MRSYFFVLGRENKISQKEVERVLASFGFCLNEAKSDYSISILNQEVLEINSKGLSDEIIKKLIEILGGTVKIFRRIGESDSEILETLKGSNHSEKLVFGISNYSKKKVDTFRMGLGIKKIVKELGPVRIIPPKDSDRLSSAQSYQYEFDKSFSVIPDSDRGSSIGTELSVDSRLRGNDKQKTGFEFGIFDSGIGQLVAVQNINFWSEIDYGKPKSDAKSGMLPPKLARIMINLAVSEIENSKFEARNSKQIRINKIKNSKPSDFGFRYSNLRPLIVDPFCGSGNILMQAAILGFPFYGSDISEKAIEDTKANLNWLSQKRKVKSEKCNEKFRIICSDSTKFNFNELLTLDFSLSTDYVIVTEPNLGEPRREKFSEAEAEVSAKQIVKLYKKFFENLAKAKNQPLSICMVFPLLELNNYESLSVFSSLVDFLESLGYIISYPPLKYGRADQIVKRQIVLLKILNPKL